MTSLTQIEALVGLYNGGDTTYNVTAIYGSLNAAHDYRLFFQNFSGLVSASFFRRAVVQVCSHDPVSELGAETVLLVACSPITRRCGPESRCRCHTPS